MLSLVRPGNRAARATEGGARGPRGALWLLAALLPAGCGGGALDQVSTSGASGQAGAAQAGAGGSAAAGATGGANPGGAAGTGDAAGMGGAGGAVGAGAGGSAGQFTGDLKGFAKPKKSCAYHCPGVDACAEQKAPYGCQNLGEWASLPHDAMACGSWDGTYPAVTPGACSASAPAGEALRYAGADVDHPGVRVLPDGRRIHPAGKETIFAEPDLIGGLTTGVMLVAGTKLAITVDTGGGDHVLRVVDTQKIGAGDPIVSRVAFHDPETLNSGLTQAAPDLVFVATNDGVVQALSLDKAGVLQRDDARSIKLPSSFDSGGAAANWYVSGVAATPDGKALVVTGVNEHKLLVYSLEKGTYGQKLGEADLGLGETFGVWFDPNDTSGRFAYVAMWADATVIEVDLLAKEQPVVARSFSTDRDPQGVAFLDARWMVVANDLGDSLSLVDRTSGAVTRVPVEILPGAHGLEPSGLAYDAARKRLYASLAGINAVGAYDVDISTSPPTLASAGKLGASWWPSAVAVQSDGSVVVSSMRGHGSGPTSKHFGVGDGDIEDRMRGGIQIVPSPSGSDLAVGDAEVTAGVGVGALAGYPKVSCPAGAADFPVPEAGGGPPSAQIKHVFLIVRENKDFDGLFGDLQGVEGDPSLTLRQSSADMDQIWKNLRTLARTFSLSDNYYTDAVYSTQGHVLTTYGRSNDFNERTWATSGSGRNSRPIPGGGVIAVGQPAEGSFFDLLQKQGVNFDILGEIVGSPALPMGAKIPSDVHYPGGPFQNILYNDLEKACYTAGRARVLCDLGSFVYMTISNDHTGGVSPDSPTPEVYCAVNDEATGMMIDALSHSPLWASSVVFITEDDPSQGGEHIDSHRAPFVVISPWVKRGYVSKTHIDVASIHKLTTHVLGLPYPNLQVASAGLPLDMFSSTPDFTPYTYTPRSWPLTCGKAASTAEAQLTASWDFDEPDEQPGLDAQVTRWMRGKQRSELTAADREKIARRRRDRALHLDAPRDDDR